MSDDIINQTEFTEESHLNVPTPAPTVVTSQSKKRSPILMVSVVAAVLVIVLGSVTFIKYNTGKSGGVTSTATPTPSEAPIETQGIRTEIAPFLQTIQDSNPESDEHPFPPVNFDVRIKDPDSKE